MHVCGTCDVSYEEIILFMREKTKTLFLPVQTNALSGQHECIVGYLGFMSNLDLSHLSVSLCVC